MVQCHSNVTLRRFTIKRPIDELILTLKKRIAFAVCSGITRVSFSCAVQAAAPQKVMKALNHELIRYLSPSQRNRKWNEIGPSN